MVRIMNKETQVVLLAGGFGIAGTLLGALVQGFNSERVERRRRLEEREEKIRLERRESLVRALAAYHAAVKEIDDATRPAYRLGKEETLGELSDEEFNNMRATATSARHDLLYAGFEASLFRAGEVDEAMRKLDDTFDALSKDIKRDMTLEVLNSHADAMGREYADVIAVIRRDLKYE
jgi:hypothetical protein